MTDQLRDLLATLSPGPIPNLGDLERSLAACWHEFKGDDGGMEGYKLLHRMENVAWHPPILSFTIERHGGTVLRSSRATLQEWWLDLFAPIPRKPYWELPGRERPQGKYRW